MRTLARDRRTLRLLAVQMVGMRVGAWILCLNFAKECRHFAAVSHQICARFSIDFVQNLAVFRLILGAFWRPEALPAAFRQKVRKRNADKAYLN